MNRVWIPPPFGFVKLNVFETGQEIPLDNGNTNGVCIIMRDHNGFHIWGVMGPFKDLTHFQAQLWAIHMGMKEAFSRGFNNMLIETEHVDSFRILRRQDFGEASREELVDPIQAINACNPLLPSDTEPICRIYPVFAERNQVARFGANFGLHNLSEIVEVDYSFQPLRDLLDIDIGWGPHLPALVIQPNLGLGEVIQGLKPKRQKRAVVEEKEYEALLKLNEKVAHLENILEEQLKFMETKEQAFSLKSDPSFAFRASQSSKGIKIQEGGFKEFKLTESKSATIEHVGASSSDKGKAKLFEGASFNDKGLMSTSAVNTMDSLGLAAKDLDKKLVNNGIGGVNVVSVARIIESSLNHSNSETVLATASMPKEQATPVINERNISPLDQEAIKYLQDSVHNLIDPQVEVEELMSLDAVLLEFALLEDMHSDEEGLKQ